MLWTLPQIKRCGQLPRSSEPLSTTPTKTKLLVSVDSVIRIRLIRILKIPRRNFILSNGPKFGCSEPFSASPQVIRTLVSKLSSNGLQQCALEASEVCTRPAHTQSESWLSSAATATHESMVAIDTIMYAETAKELTLLTLTESKRCYLPQPLQTIPW